MAVDSSHIYWANHVTNTIGRADVDGQNVDQNFITGASRPYFVAVDSRYIYWTNTLGNTVPQGGLGWAKRKVRTSSSLATAPLAWLWIIATSTGTNTNYENGPAGLTWTGKTWTRTSLSLPAKVWVCTGWRWTATIFTGPTSITPSVRAELDGQNVNLTFVSGCQQPRGVAVDRSHVYWAE